MRHIEIVDTFPEIEGNLYCFEYKLNKKSRRMRVMKEDIMDVLNSSATLYQEGIRKENLEEVFKESLSENNYRYVLMFIEYFHDI